MTGTELGRLLAEVTEQPPVDVDLGAVARKVKRHRSRVRSAAVVGSVLVVALIVAVPVLGRSRGGTEAAGPSPTPAPTPSWVERTWGGFQWQQPTAWKLIDTGVGNHGRPFNANIQGPFLSTEPLAKGCSPTSDGFECNPIQVLKRLPTNGVVVELIGSYAADPHGAPADDKGTLRAPDVQCRAWGAYAHFTASRSFGPAKAPHVLQLSGCVGKAVAHAASLDLRRVMASATDSAYPARPALGPLRARATLAGPITAEAVCQAALGKFASATLTTVGEIRTASWGPAISDGKGGTKGRLANAFPGAKASDIGAWCWTGRSGDYTGYAVHVGDKPVETTEIIGTSATAPSGPPTVP